MAGLEDIPVIGGLGNLFSSVPPTDANYPALEARRRIALQMLMNQGRKGYPKNTGEGIASIGDSIMEGLQMREAQRMEDAYQAKIAAAAGAGPPSAQPGATPGQRADIAPDDSELPTRTATVTPDDTPPPAVVADATPVPARRSAVPTAAPIVRMKPDGSLDRNITSDEPLPAPPPLVAPTRSVGAAPPSPFATGGTPEPYSMGLPEGEQSAKMAAVQQSATIAALRARMQPPIVAGNEGSLQQGARLASSFDQFAPATRSVAPPSLSSSISSAAPMTPQDAQQARLLGEVTGMGSGDRGYAYAPTASLGRAGDVASDAPGVTGISPVNAAVTDTVQQMRDAIAKRGAGQLFPAPEVPQPNPTQAGPTAPVTLTAAMAGSPPEAATNRPIVMPDVKPAPEAPAPAPGAQMVQNAVPATRTSPAPLPYPTPQPVAPIDPSIANKPVEPPMPKMEPKGPDQLYYEKMKDTVAGDPFMTKIYQDKIDREEAVRGFKDAQNKAKWEAQMRQFGENTTAWQQRNSPLGLAQTGEAQSKASAAADAADLSSRTGLPADQAKAKFDDLKKGAEKDAYALQQLRIAKQALNSGVVSGIGGQFRLNLERAKALFGNKPAAELAARSEQFLTAVKSTVGNALQNFQPGDPRVTNSDVVVASGMIGADPGLQHDTQMKLINTQFEDVNRRVKQYEDLKDHYLGGSKLEKFYDVQIDPIHPDKKVEDAYVGALIKNQTNPDAVREFNDKFGPGAAEVEIARANRAARRKMLQGGQ